ncbi:hypothetical protein JCM14244_01370 [Venenivibrio stagnispumantis]|uniref:Protein-export membrane protein SecG n=1 Tax=Venenivibrio stagnispumantis TaxID=407998 RepID=A0AA46ADM2_9AQUI|nr:preprotein translocase subunit SecG [Venenivibrio stagnispumantis]MCW4573476.1 preprotein translocase subunit SecG [Venenivibrio stagnispumantis]SMP06786.1 protein translocase subunit secG [Venenivibrio stagnispumantis]
MDFIYGVLLVVLIIVSIILIALILMQKTKGAEIGAVFGSGAAKAILGASAANIITKITFWLAGIFMGLVLLLSYLHHYKTKQNSVIETLPTQNQTEKK